MHITKCKKGALIIQRYVATYKFTFILRRIHWELLTIRRRRRLFKLSGHICMEKNYIPME